MRFSLRDYQKKAIHAVLQQRREGYRRLLVCLPTGAGKTVIFSELCRLANRDVLVLAHREDWRARHYHPAQGAGAWPARKGGRRLRQRSRASGELDLRRALVRQADGCEPDEVAKI